MSATVHVSRESYAEVLRWDGLLGGWVEVDTSGYRMGSESDGRAFVRAHGPTIAAQCGDGFESVRFQVRAVSEQVLEVPPGQ